jgi:hypothetical protein
VKQIAAKVRVIAAKVPVPKSPWLILLTEAQALTFVWFVIDINQ